MKTAIDIDSKTFLDKYCRGFVYTSSNHPVPTKTKKLIP